MNVHACAEIRTHLHTHRHTHTCHGFYHRKQCVRLRLRGSFGRVTGALKLRALLFVPGEITFILDSDEQARTASSPL